nr:hypothetical protein B0A51_14630 [Rachicladosporium sp. CCFEE 5018]
MPKRKRDLEVAQSYANVRKDADSDSGSSCIEVRPPLTQPAARTSRNTVRKGKRAKIVHEEEDELALIQEPKSPHGVVFVPYHERERAKCAYEKAQIAQKEAQRAQKEAERSHQASTRNPGASSALASFRGGGLRSATVSAPLAASSPLEAFTSGQFRNVRPTPRPYFSKVTRQPSLSSSTATSPTSSVGPVEGPASSRTSPDGSIDMNDASASSTPETGRPRRRVNRPSYLYEAPQELSEDELAADDHNFSTKKTKRKSKSKKEEEDQDYMFDAEQLEVESAEDASEMASVEGTESEGSDGEDDMMDDEAESDNKRKRTAEGAPAKIKNGRTATSGAREQMISYLPYKGTVDTSLPPIHEIDEMFSDMVLKADGLGLTDALSALHRPLRVATMCSGTESPLLAMEMIADALQGRGITLDFDHLFSAEITPFKQAYIQRNFNPALIFRDVGELIEAMKDDVPHATTAYNAVVPVPANVDILIAGTSCKDFSNLNNWQQDLDEDGGGESSKTWFGVLAYVKATRPRIVVLENVSGAPFDQMMDFYRNMGYEVTGVLVDTKNFYIPQTRQRGYVVAFDNTRGGKLTGAGDAWATMMGHMQRVASSPLADFLLPNDELRSRPHETLDVMNKKEVDWAKCHTRHTSTRHSEGLGGGRETLKWTESGAILVQEHGSAVWFKRIVNRVRDYIEMAVLRKARKEEDIRFKSRVYDVSQNIDLTKGEGSYGICPCIHPTGAFYASDAARILTAEETLKLQGIPLNKISFTNETQAEIQDLAGNAMTSVVVGSAILCALTHGMPAIAANVKGAAPANVYTPLQQTAVGIRPVPEHAVTKAAQQDEMFFDVQTAASAGARSVRRCYCEGAQDVTVTDIQQCVDCAHTSCVKCGGSPAHDYVLADELGRDSPLAFEKSLRSKLPLQLGFGVTQLDRLLKTIRKSVKDRAYADAVTQALRSDFSFASVARKRDWVVNYTAPTAELRLVLNADLAEWRLFAMPPSLLPAKHHMRKMLRQPIARCVLQTSSLFAGQWQWRDLPASTYRVSIKAQGVMVPTWRAMLKLPKCENPTAPSQLRINAPDELLISGTYTALPKCGTAHDSLYKRMDPPGKPLYLFQDPTRTGDAKLDTFVFAHNHERLDYGEHRISVAHLEPAWKPWAEADIFSDACVTSDALWRDTEQLLSASIRPAKILLPVQDGDRIPQLGCQSAELIVSCEVQGISELVGKTSSISASNTRFFTDHAWVLEMMRRNLPSDEWQSLSLAVSSDCKTCSPARPALRWSIDSDNRLIGIEDKQESTRYEREVKHQHEPLVLKTSTSNGVTTLSFGIDLASMAHKAIASLRVPSQPTSLRWRLHSIADASDFRVRPFRLQKTVFRPYTRDVGMMSIKGVPQDLMPQQKAQLAWLRQQETDDGAPFELEAVQEAQLTCWRAEVQATTSIHVRGSICADHPGFGKTLTSLALIHAHLLDGQKALMQDLEQRQLKCPKAEGLIPTKATLIIAPSALVDQWIAEAADKFGYTSGVLRIKTMAMLDKYTMDDFKDAKIIVVNRNLLENESYGARLADFVAISAPAVKYGRAYTAWHALASQYVHKHLGEFEKGGPSGLRQYNTEVEAERKQTFWGSASQQRSSKKASIKSSTKEQRPAKLPTRLAPLFEMFWFNRMIVDEFHDCSSQIQDMLKAIQADKRHLLSGTPCLNDTYGVAQIAGLLGVPLAYGSSSSSAMTKGSRDAIKKDATDLELFEQSQRVMSHSMHARIYQRAQIFLDTFARQNVMDGEPLPVEERLVPIKLDRDHMVMYKEIAQDLISRNMVLQDSKDSRTTGQVERFRTASKGYSHGEEVLSRRAALLLRTHMSKRTIELPKGLASLISGGQAEIDRLVMSSQEACRRAQKAQNAALEAFEAEALLKDLTKAPFSLGDGDAIDIVQQAIDAHRTKLPREQWIPELEKLGKIKKTAGTLAERLKKLDKDALGCALERDTTTVVRTISEDLVTAIRTRRFIANVVRLPKTPRCEVDDCKYKKDGCGVSALCGHLICEHHYNFNGPDSICPVDGCQASMRDHHMLWSHALGSIEGSSNYGAKIEKAVKLLEEIRALEDRAVLFVQYASQLEDIAHALEAAGIDATVVHESAQAGDLIRAFAADDSNDTVIVLDASSETAAGSNLQCANHVIFLSPLLCKTQYKYDATMAQAVGRVKRHGQKKTIHVHRLLALYTIDVDILEARERLSQRTHDDKVISQQGGFTIPTPPPMTIKRAGRRPTVKTKYAKLVNEANYYSLRPYSWVAGQQGKEVLEKQDFSSHVTFSERYQD